MKKTQVQMIRYNYSLRYATSTSISIVFLIRKACSQVLFIYYFYKLINYVNLVDRSVEFLGGCSIHFQMEECGAFMLKDANSQYFSHPDIPFIPDAWQKVSHHFIFFSFSLLSIESSRENRRKLFMSYCSPYLRRKKLYIFLCNQSCFTKFGEVRLFCQ